MILRFESTPDRFEGLNPLPQAAYHHIFLSRSMTWISLSLKAYLGDSLEYGQLGRIWT